ncbi:hypothetical protein PXK00_04640 [Phaeobacter sp. QD34_3]|nr:hypothetical protein [Phaeobacter sp. QD34_3]MDE4173846.1 hypothetical protein [Phaeobacter sp. PT47_59]
MKKFDQITSRANLSGECRFSVLSQGIGAFVLVLSHQGFNLRRD